MPRASAMLSSARILSCSVFALTAGAALGSDGVAASPGATPPSAGLASPLKSSHGCLASGSGYLRAKIRGTLRLDVNFHDSELECDGGARPDGSGIRVSFAGPLRSDGRRLRMVFGIAGAGEGAAGHELPANLTVIFEGEERIFATRGDDRCTVDELRQERVGALAGPTRSYRVIARGFCIDPISSLRNGGQILVSSFDFAGSVTFEDTH
jgi:hypothetical protein